MEILKSILLFALKKKMKYTLNFLKKISKRFSLANNGGVLVNHFKVFQIAKQHTFVKIDFEAAVKNIDTRQKKIKRKNMDDILACHTGITQTQFFVRN